MSTQSQITHRNFGIVAIFDKLDVMRRALADLHKAGIPAEFVSVIGKEGHTAPELHQSALSLADEIDPPVRDELLGGVIGGYAALWGGLLLFAIPGFGTAVLAGGIAVALASGVATVVTGAGVGALWAAVLSEQHTDHHRGLYEQALKDGKWLLVIHATQAEYVIADAKLRGYAMSHIDRFVA